MGTAVFWVLLPYLIAAFVAVARKSQILERQSPMEFGKEITQITREVLRRKERKT